MDVARRLRYDASSRACARPAATEIHRHGTSSLKIGPPATTRATTVAFARHRAPPAVCRAVTEQTVGPSWVQARRVEPACSLQVPHTPDVWTVRPRGSRGPNSRQDVQAHGREHMEHRRSRAHTARTVRIQVRFLSLFFPPSSDQTSPGFRCCLCSKYGVSRLLRPH